MKKRQRINVPRGFQKARETYVNKILVFGGFGGRNAGDEAQIDQTYRELTERYPNYEIRVASHVQKVSFEKRGIRSVSDNSRLAIWGAGLVNNRLYYFSRKSDINILWMIRFLWKGYRCLLNSYLVKWTNKTFLLDVKCASLIYDIATSNVLYISGSGFLTGDTLSRLWDHLFVMRIASIFNVPVVMSGQNIGIWDSDFTRKFAKKGFEKAAIITTRDGNISINELKKIGVEGEHIFSTHDDALFCAKETDIEMIYNAAKLQVGERYVAINVVDRYWGEEHLITRCMNHVIKEILETTDLQIIFFSMDFGEEGLIHKIMDIWKTDRIHFVSVKDYDFKIIRGIISKSEMCITMRHHPIVFAIGEKVPVISLYANEYYYYKNYGALSLVGMCSHLLSMEDDNFDVRFNELFHGINSNEFAKKIDGYLPELCSLKSKFYAMLSELLDRKPRLVAFGAGDCFVRNEQYLSKYYNLLYVVDNDESKWEKTIGESEIVCHAPSCMMNDKQLNIIITIDNCRVRKKIKKQIRRMGIKKIYDMDSINLLL